MIDIVPRNALFSPPGWFRRRGCGVFIESMATQPHTQYVAREGCSTYLELGAFRWKENGSGNDLYGLSLSGHYLSLPPLAMLRTVVLSIPTIPVLSYPGGGSFTTVWGTDPLLNNTCLLQKIWPLRLD